MDIDVQGMRGSEAYRFMIQAIVPRPVAWILSDNGTGTYNLAPFSFFSGLTSRPPTLAVSIGTKRDGTKKDTWRNIEERMHFVVHIPSVAAANAVNATSASLAFGDSEVDHCGIALSPQPGWPLPRVTSARLALLCSRYQIVEVGAGPQGLIIGQIERAFVDDDIASRDDSGAVTVAIEDLDPLVRLGGSDYASLDAGFSLPRPT